MIAENKKQVSFDFDQPRKDAKMRNDFKKPWYFIIVFNDNKPHISSLWIILCNFESRKVNIWSLQYMFLSL